MGSSGSKLSNELINDWMELTYLKKSEILQCFARFREMNEARIGANPLGERVPIPTVIGHFPELKSNPFADRLCQVFSSERDDQLSFEDFLDMMSVLSATAPIQVKADWAFRIFDFESNGYIGPHDIRRIVERITGSDRPRDEEMDNIVRHVLQEADVHGTDTIGPQEFRNVMGKSSDFRHNFTLRL